MHTFTRTVCSVVLLAGWLTHQSARAEGPWRWLGGRQGEVHTDDYLVQSSKCFRPRECPVQVCPAPEPAAPRVDQPAPQQPAPEQPPAAEPSFSPEQFAATGSGEEFAAASPNVIGDGSVTTCFTRVIRNPIGLPPVTVTTCVTRFVPDMPSMTDEREALAASAHLAARVNSYKIAENESPRPQSRVFLNYNYYHNVNGLGADVHREMPGFEQTFLDGDASFGMRFPAFQDTNGLLNLDGFGDIVLNSKFAWINDRSTGEVFSTGLSLVVPSGRTFRFPQGGTIRDEVFLPWVGGIFSRPRYYIQGFSSASIPTDFRDFAVYFDDVSAGYWLMRNNADSGLTGIVPTIEAHVTAPMNHRGLSASGIGMQDSVALTFGSHFIIAQRGILTLGVVTPVTGPKMFDVEALAQFNLRY